MNLSLLKEKRQNAFFKFLFFLQKPRVKKIFSVIFFIIFIGSIFPLHFASANTLGDILNWIKWGIIIRMPITLMVIPLYIVAFITLPFVGFWGLMVHWIMSPDFTSFPYTRPGLPTDVPPGNPIIQAGLQVTFPIANMFIILALVFIAIATILRINSYTLNKLLPMLIIIALLINFAPVLCGVIVDFANVFMNFFSGHVGGLQGMSQIGKTLWGEGGFWGDIMAMWGLRSGSEIATYISPIAKTIAVIVYNLVASVTLQMFFVLLFLRYIMIWLLVILSPLAIASYVLPFTRSLFKWWWNQLVQWSFVGVIGAFFLYLSAQTLSLMGKANLTPPAADTTWLTEIMNGILPATFAIAILMIGFFATIKSGAMFAGAAAGAVSSASKGLMGWVGGKAAGGAMSGARSFATKQYNKKGEETLRYRALKRIESSRFSPVAPGKWTGASKGAVIDESEKLEKEMKGQGPETYRTLLEKTKKSSLNNPKKAAQAHLAIKKLTEMNELKEEDKSTVDRLEKLGHKDVAKAARKKLPTLVVDPHKSDLENQNTLNKVFDQTTNEERPKVQPKTYNNVQAMVAALRSVKTTKDFDSLISNPESAGIIGTQMMGMSKDSLAVGTNFEDHIKRELGDQQGSFIMSQVNKESTQRRTKVKYDSAQKRFVNS